MNIDLIAVFTDIMGKYRLYAGPREKGGCEALGTDLFFKLKTPFFCFSSSF